MEENKKEFPDVYGVIVVDVANEGYPWTVTSTSDTPTQDAHEEVDRPVIDHLERELSDIPDEKLCELVDYEITKMCRSAGESLRTSLPVNYRDTGVLISELLRRFKDKIED